MTCHGDGWEEIAGSILHIDTLQGIRIVTYPELIKTTETSPVGTSTTTGTALDNDILVLSTDTIDNLSKPLMVCDIETTLISGRKILTTMIHDSHIGIPLDIGNLRILSKQIIYYTKYEILHLRITEIKNQLSATTTNYRITLRRLDHPIRMLLVKFTLGISHFRLNPDTELHAILLGITKQAFDTVRQFFGIYYPIAQSSIIFLARIFLSEPSIVHYEELTTHAMDISHHLIHTLLVDIEVNTLPRVQEDITLLITMSKHVLATPLMEVAAGTAQALIGISKRKSRSLESFTLLEMIF